MKKILAVDDSPQNLSMLNGILSGLYKVYLADSGTAALRFLKNHTPDLILLDVAMPEMSGNELMSILKSDIRLTDIPVIFLTATNDIESEVFALESGAVDYIRKPVNSMIMQARLKLHLELEEYRKNLQTLVGERTRENQLLQKLTLDLLACVTEFRDRDTGDHVKRSAEYVGAIMDELSKDALPDYYISQSYYDHIKESTPLHDIGKISIPDAILLKPGRLTAEEFDIMKSHVTAGAEILQNAINKYNGPSFLDVALEIVLTHHEKWNGTGYPNQLAGKDIPLSGRIMALADVYDALTSKRPYKLPITHEKALEIITEGIGSHFDPVLARVFLNIEDKIWTIHEWCGDDEA